MLSKIYRDFSKGYLYPYHWLREYCIQCQNNLNYQKRRIEKTISSAYAGFLYKAQIKCFHFMFNFQHGNLPTERYYKVRTNLP